MHHWHDDDVKEYAAELAKKLAGNHRKFTSFAWFDRPDNDEGWALVYTHNRDSNALDRSNAHVIEKTLETFPETDVRVENHSHWAVGWVKGFAIRVYDANGDVTPALLAYASLAMALEEYPVLDEEHFSETEQEEADQYWQGLFFYNGYRGDRARLEYIRDHRRQFEFHDWADLMGCVRGRYFTGYASELLA